MDDDGNKWATSSKWKYFVLELSKFIMSFSQQESQSCYGNKQTNEHQCSTEISFQRLREISKDTLQYWKVQCNPRSQKSKHFAASTVSFFYTPVFSIWGQCLRLKMYWCGFSWAGICIRPMWHLFCTWSI